MCLHDKQEIILDWFIITLIELLKYFFFKDDIGFNFGDNNDIRKYSFIEEIICADAWHVCYLFI